MTRCFVISLFLVPVILTSVSYAKTVSVPISRNKFVPAKPSASQAKWLDYEVGASIHFNMQTFARNMKRGDVVSADTFNPQNLSTDQWANVADSFGARYVILTLDHFSGFLLWPSKNYNYSVKTTKWRDGKANVALDFINSCKKKQLEHGYFYSVNKNWNMNVQNYSTLFPRDQEKYNDIVLGHFRELLGNGSVYSNPFFWWFDAGTNPKTNPYIGPLIRSLAKDMICDECLTFAGNQGARWIGNENAVAPLPNWYAVPNGKCYVNLEDPRGEQFCPGSCDTVVREHYWFWKPGTEHTLKTPQRLIREYLTSVGRGAPLVLNLSPDESGLVPEEDVAVYRALGEGIKLLYKHQVLKIERPIITVQQTFKVELPSQFNATNGSFVIMEDIQDLGQRVEKYRVQYITADDDVANEEGSSIGHKRIHVFPIAVRGSNVNKIELTITSLLTDDTKIQLREIAVYDWSEAEEKGYLDQDKIVNPNQRLKDDNKADSVSDHEYKRKCIHDILD